MKALVGEVPSRDCENFADSSFATLIIVSGCRVLFILSTIMSGLVQVVAPLCREIETELRLAVHKQAGLQLDERNPFRTAPVELRPFLDTPPLAILGTRLRSSRSS